MVPFFPLCFSSSRFVVVVFVFRNLADNRYDSDVRLLAGLSSRHDRRKCFFGDVVGTKSKKKKYRISLLPVTSVYRRLPACVVCDHVTFLSAISHDEVISYTALRSVGRS